MNFQRDLKSMKTTVSTAVAERLRCVRAGRCLVPLAAGLVLLAMTGCAGPKFMSTGSGTDQQWNAPRSATGLALRSLSIRDQFGGGADEASTSHLLESVANKLRQTALFTNVTVIASTNPPTMPLLLELRVLLGHDPGYGARAMIGSPSVVGAAGRIVDWQNDKVLATFASSRSSSGRLLGAGGWLTAGEATMNRKLVEWIADDVVAVVKKLQH